MTVVGRDLLRSPVAYALRGCAARFAASRTAHSKLRPDFVATVRRWPKCR